MSLSAPARRAFFDTKVALYLLSADERKAGLAEDVLAEGGHISVQVLHEFVAVARREHQVPWPQVQATLDALCQVCAVAPLTLAVHQQAVALSQRLGYTIHDATIVASALSAGCDCLYTEDLQHGQVIDGLQLRNPFV